jgi:hypothetical protein
MEGSESREIRDWDEAVVVDSTALSGSRAGAKIDLVSEDLFAKSVKRLSSSRWPISSERPKASELETGIIAAICGTQFIVVCSGRMVKKRVTRSGLGKSE